VVYIKKADNEINNKPKNIANLNNILKLKESVISKYSQHSLITTPLKIIANIRHMIPNISTTTINYSPLNQIYQ
jgi:hypothetical protein